MSKVMQIIRVGALALTTATVLTACGGGGGTAAVAPVAEVSAGVTGNNQLNSQLSGISNLRTVALQQSTTTTSSSSASMGAIRAIYADLKDNLSNLIKSINSTLISSAIAQAASGSSGASSTSTSNTCAVKKLVGYDASNQPIDLSLTSSTDSCVGVTDMFDHPTYILFAAEGIYKDGKTCNLVFAQKSTGTLFCLGENQRSRYSFTRKDGNNWKKYDILQPTVNGEFIFLEAKVDLFNDEGNKTGETIKILRFDLRDAAGPTALTVIEGENTSWYNMGNSGDYTNFSINGFSGVENGDVAISYQIYIYNNTFGSNTSSFGTKYFRFNTSTGAFNEPTDIAVSDNGYNSNWWSGGVSCWLGSDATNFYFADQAGNIRKGSYSSSNGSVTVVNAGTNAQPTKICSNWGMNKIVKANGKFYSTDTSGYSGSSTSSTANLISRGLEDAQDTVLTSVTVDRSWTNPVLSMSKDGNMAFITIGASDVWGWDQNTYQSTRTTKGAEVHKVVLNASSITSTRILQSSDKVWISSIANVGSDGIYSFTGRDLNSALFTKINVSIDAAGTISRSNQSTTSSDILNMIRL